MAALEARLQSQLFGRFAGTCESDGVKLSGRIKSKTKEIGIGALPDSHTQTTYTVLPRAGMITLVITLLGTAALIILRQNPDFDVAVSRLFYTAGGCELPGALPRCTGFLYADSPFWVGLRESGYYIPQLLMLVIFLWQTWQLFFVRSKTLRDIVIPIVAINSAALGPGIITNLILKSHWGRPRPFATDDFLGEFPFVLPGDIANYCETNCSFVSGEATAAFWMLALALYFTGRKRWLVSGAIVILACFISFLRVVFGKHYFSDIVMAAFIALWCITFMCWAVQTGVVSRWINWILNFSNWHAFNIGRSG